jgi:chain length determinant protein tyrosine kinase EpsG
MAKFRDSTPDPVVADVEAPPRPAAPPTPLHAARPTEFADGQHGRSIGDIIAELRNLSADEVERVLAYQRKEGVRFGEAAVVLGLATKEDVLFALAQQFDYPYAPEEKKRASPELVALNEPFSSRAESFRALRSQLMMRAFNADGGRHALAVISPDGGDGKTYCAANLAVVLAQLGGRTLLVDADMRAPRQHEVFGLGSHAGLSSILSGRADKQVIQQVGLLPGLFVLPVGTTPPNPLELVERPAFGLLMRELVSKFDHVVVDTPAAAWGADAAVIAARCGHALVVARKNASRVSSLQDLVASFAGSPAKIVGAVVNER